MATIHFEKKQAKPVHPYIGSLKKQIRILHISCIVLSTLALLGWAGVVWLTL